MYCENCGKQLPGTTKFCDQCGTRTSVPISAPPAEEALKAEPEAQAAPPPPKPAPQPQTIFSNTLSLDRPLSVGSYLGIFFLMSIPIINIIMVFVWALGSTVNRNKKNYAIAVLILMAISIILTILLAVFILPLFASLFQGIFTNGINRF